MPGLFDQAVWLYRRNFRTFLGISAIVQLPAAVLLALASTWLLSDYSATLTRNLSQTTTIESGDSQQAFITSMTDCFTPGQPGLVRVADQHRADRVAAGALARAIADRYLGRPITVWGTYRAIRPQYHLADRLRLHPGRRQLPLHPAAARRLCVYRLELRQPGDRARKTSMWSPPCSVAGNWCRGQWWRVFGMGVLVLLVRTVMVLPSTVVGEALVFLGASSGLQLFASQFATLALELVYLPAQLAAVTLLYYDLRIRKEGYDLEIAIAERRAALGAPVLGIGAWGSEIGDQGSGIGIRDQGSTDAQRLISLVTSSLVPHTSPQPPTPNPQPPTPRPRCWAAIPGGAMSAPRARPPPSRARRPRDDRGGRA